MATSSRRTFIAAASAVLIGPGRTLAQTGVPLVAQVSPGLAENYAIRFAAFERALRESGYVIGRNLRYEQRFAGGDLDFARGQAIVREVLAMQPDVLVASGGASPWAVTETTTVPIVVLNANLEVGFEWVGADFGRPAGNVTGIFNPSRGDLVGKHFQLMAELLPRATTFGYLVDLSAAQDERLWGETAAAAVGVKLIVAEYTGTGDALPAFQALVRAGVDAVVAVRGNVSLNAVQEDMHRIALTARLPVSVQGAANVRRGGLFSYNQLTDEMQLGRRAAAFVDKMLRGTRVADLPAEVANEFELAINLATSRSLGITLPLSLLARADVVIE